MFRLNLKDSRTLFAIGFAVVLLSIAVPILPFLRTFIHMWQVELVASVFLLTALIFVLYISSRENYAVDFPRLEVAFVLLPITALIAWSLLSTAWAPSWKSSLHHTFVWAEYLTFYILVRKILASPKGYGKMLPVLAAAFVFVSMPAIVEYVSLLAFGGGTSIGLRYARYGEQVNTLLPLIMVAALGQGGKRLIACLFALAAVWLLIFVSLGRTNIALFALSALTITACVFLFKRFRKYRLRAVLILLTLIVVLVPLHAISLFSNDPRIPVVNRVNDQAAISSSNGFRKLMASISLEMFEQNPVGGVGADNFGMQLNEYRTAYAAENPTDPNLVNAENEIPERSHNEYLQILAELGIVGGLIFACFLCGIGLMLFRALRKRTSLVGMAALLGVLVFLASSLVTSYSFRLIQNGFVFFFVLAVAARILLKPNKKDDGIVFSRSQIRVVCAAGMACCLGLATYSSVRVASAIYASKADTVLDLEEASKLYQTAIRLDDENPDAEFSLGYRLMDAKRYAEASEHFERSIRIGRGPSISYSYLATSYLMGGKPAEAERSFAQAVKMYPMSAFARTRYAFILQENDELERSGTELEKARSIKAADAVTWWTMMNEGAKKATENANRDKTISPIMDLRPTAAIYAILFERIIEHPEEKSTLDFMK